jgi:hypothetical protein
MKYRLTELLQCPSHPHHLLRVTQTRLSEMFPLSEDIRNPYCRTGCGLLGNWFSEIPSGLPPANRLKCRQCLGMEIEEASLGCLECGWSMNIKDGVLIPGTVVSKSDGAEEEHIPAEAGKIIGRQTNLKSGDLVLVLASMPLAILDRWACTGVEQVRIETQPETIVSHRAKSCAEGHGVVHYITGPINCDIIRPGQFDAIVVSYPSSDLVDSKENLALLPELLRPSGRILMAIKRTGPRLSVKNRIRKYLEDLPGSFRRFTTRLASKGNLDLLLLGPHDEDKPRKLTMKEIVNGSE